MSIITGPGNPEVSGTPPVPPTPLMEKKIRDLEDAFKIVKKQIKFVNHTNEKNLYRLACFVFIFAVILVWFFHDPVGDIITIHNKLGIFDNSEYRFGWEVILYVISKIVLLSILLGAISYMLRLLKSYLHIYNRGRQRLFIVNSMASLIGSANPRKEEDAYDKLLEIVIGFDETGLLKEKVELDPKNKILDKLNELSENIMRKVGN